MAHIGSTAICFGRTYDVAILDICVGQVGEVELHQE